MRVATARAVQQRKRHERRLAGAGRRLQDEIAMCVEGVPQLGKRVDDRQPG
jgi:hypothetical protein